jgi:hypothetical protein
MMNAERLILRLRAARSMRSSISGAKRTGVRIFLWRASFETREMEASAC